MTTLRDKIRDVIADYHNEIEENGHDQDALTDNIMDEVVEYLTKIIG